MKECKDSKDKKVWLILMVMIGCTYLKADTAFVPRAKWDIPAAIELARKGEPKELMITTRAIEEGTCPLPPRKEMDKYREMLKDGNGFVQHLAVQVIARAKDKENAEPLRQAIVDLQNKCANPEKLSSMEAAAIGSALSCAIFALSQVDDESSVSVAFLSTLLKNDQPMEFGGGVAHYALARKGRAGLQALLESATKPINENQERFLNAALAKITDPALAVDVYACAKDSKYHEKVRSSCIFTLAQMSKQSPDAEKLLLGLAKDEKFDKRSRAIGCLGVSGTPKAKEILHEFERTGQGDPYIVEQALMSCEFDKMITNIVERIMSPNTSRYEKERLWDHFNGRVDDQLRPHERLLSQCLKVSNVRGTPLSDFRLNVWHRLYSLSNTLYPVEIETRNGIYFTNAIDSIASEIENETKRKQGANSDKKKYGLNPYEGMKMEAQEEARKLVKKWEQPTEKKEVKP